MDNGTIFYNCMKDFVHFSSWRLAGISDCWMWFIRKFKLLLSYIAKSTKKRS